MKNNNHIIVAILAVAAAFFVGYQFKRKEAIVQAKAVETGLGMVKDEVKSQASVTSQWANQLWNTWQQIWKK